MKPFFSITCASFKRLGTECILLSIYLFAYLFIYFIFIPYDSGINVNTLESSTIP